MYKYLTPILLALFVIGFSSRAEAQQNQQNPPYTIGVGLMYGTEIEQLGIRVDGYYTINPDIRAGVGLGYFFPDDFIGGVRKWFDLDLNGNYFVYSEESLSIYGLAGLNIAFLTIDFDGIDSETVTEIGLNLGAGVVYNVKFTNLLDRKSTRLNSSHVAFSYSVF